MIVDAEDTVLFTDVHVLSMLAWLFNAGGLGESLAQTFFVLHAMPCHAAFSLHKVSAVHLQKQSFSIIAASNPDAGASSEVYYPQDPGRGF